MNDRILDLYDGDPFGEVIREAERHRESHGPRCGLFPTGPLVMRLVATLVRVANPRRVLDLGAGFGYSALWLASACEEGATVEAIDFFPEHIATAKAFSRQFGLCKKLRFTVGEVSDILSNRKGPYDFIHDDAWFAAEPPYLERVIDLLQPGGTLTMPNWFLLEDAITGKPRRDWSEFAGSGWPDSTIAYAERLAHEPRLSVAWCVSPPLAIAVGCGSPESAAQDDAIVLRSR